MYRIEVLPNSTSTSAPGWAYVPDTGFDPSKAAIQPSGARKRAARNVTIGGGNTTARQNNAILKHLAELDKDNHRDVQIPVPIRQRDGAGRVSKGKVTPSVRRILMSQKTFANHLADEEAALSNQTSNGPAPALRTPVTKLAKTTPLRYKKVAAPTSTTPIPDPRRPSESLKAELPHPLAPMHKGVTPLQAFSKPVPSQGDSDPLLKPHLPSMPPFQDDNNPLLRSYVDSAPSADILEALVSAPPLSYSAARAEATSSDVPQRHFCEICGYWGRVRCMKCGVNVCGLDCKGVHDEGRCLKFYA
ncbi:MAG: hypothetical protein M1827_007242 [Pycnora praestabilis]|nr:MAG: hypothetical protein M1827_007242 [Pycnora praestabilis]